MISFHLPPTAASAAVNGQPATGFDRRRRPLPEGSFWRVFMKRTTLNAWRSAVIVEVRTYKIKPGRRDEFIRFFESRNLDWRAALATACREIPSYELRHWLALHGPCRSFRKTGFCQGCSHSDRAPMRHGSRRC